MRTLLGFAALIPFLPIVSFLFYGTVAAAVSRRGPAGAPAGADPLVLVYLVPCLNEALVIGASLDRLLAIPQHDALVLVVDDGSDDETAAIVHDRSIRDSRVRLLRRRAPHARQGKGAALNAAYRHLREEIVPGMPHWDPDRVVIVVVDADGRLQPDAPSRVAPLFAAADVAAVQVGVRMYNRDAGWLARMQDMEFLVFTEVFQRARRHWGNAGLGGNGQFVRWTALEALGDEPWTDYLTEDLDMGLRLQALGWRTAFTPETFVSQEGLISIRPLMRQRTRWFQGHLQCWSRLSELLPSPRLSGGRLLDLVVYLVSPVTVLLMTLSLLAYLPRLAIASITDWPGTVHQLLAHHGLLLWWNLVVLALAPLIGEIYRRGARRCGEHLSPARAIGYALVFSVYAYLWLPVGWRATFRILRGRRGWAKTLRLAVQPPAIADEPAPLPHR